MLQPKFKKYIVQALKSCQDNEAENFPTTDKRFNRCKSTSMAARFFHGSTCQFCMKMGTATEKLLFLDGTQAGDSTVIQTTDASTTVAIATVLASPETYMTSTGIYTLQTWY